MFADLWRAFCAANSDMERSRISLQIQHLIDRT